MNLPSEAFDTSFSLPCYPVALHTSVTVMICLVLEFILNVCFPDLEPLVLVWAPPFQKLGFRRYLSSVEWSRSYQQGSNRMFLPLACAPVCECGFRKCFMKCLTKRLWALGFFRNPQKVGSLGLLVVKWAVNSQKAVEGDLTRLCYLL